MIILFLSAKLLAAQAMTIDHIDLFVKGNILYTRIHIRNFFDDTIKETIASGMSRKFNVRFELLKADQKRLYSYVETMSLKYDIWERIYLLTSSETERQFNDIENFMHFFSDSTLINLGNINRIDKTEQLRLFIVFSQEEMSQRQQKELESWISHDAKTVESQPALETNQSFSINISKLLSLFFSGEDFADLYIYKSPFFTLRSLDKNENSSK